MLIANVRILETGYISPPYHVVFDVQTVLSLGKTDVFVDYIFNQLYEYNLNWCAEKEYEDDELVCILPPLHNFWLDKAER